MPKVREVVKRLEDEGWTLVRMKGSHRQYKHPDFRDIVTVSGHPSKNVPPGLLSDIQKKAGWK